MKLLNELLQRSIPRSCWVRSWIYRREDQGQFDQLMRELEDEDQEAFTNVLRLTPEMFKELEQRLHERLEKWDTFFRKALSPVREVCTAIIEKYGDKLVR